MVKPEDDDDEVKPDADEKVEPDADVEKVEPDEEPFLMGRTLPTTRGNYRLKVINISIKTNYF